MESKIINNLITNSQSPDIHRMGNYELLIKNYEL